MLQQADSIVGKRFLGNVLRSMCMSNSNMHSRTPGVMRFCVSGSPDLQFQILLDGFQDWILKVMTLMVRKVMCRACVHQQ